MFAEGGRCLVLPLNTEYFRIGAQNRRQILMPFRKDLLGRLMTQQHVELVGLVNTQVGLLLLHVDRPGQVDLGFVVLVLPLPLSYHFSRGVALVRREDVA